MLDKKCDVCGSGHDKITDTCDYCQSIINRLKDRKHKKKRYGAQNVKKALQKANPIINKNEEVMFQCRYTKIYSYFNTERKIGLNPDEDACVLTIDHEDPDDPELLVVSLYIINQMKHNLPKDKFKTIIITLGKYFENKLKQNEFEDHFKKLIKCFY